MLDGCRCLFDVSIVRSNRNVRHAHRLAPFTLVPTSRNEVNFPGDSFPADLAEGDYLVVTLTMLEDLPPQP
jgi:hypothetical protein